MMIGTCGPHDSGGFATPRGETSACVVLMLALVVVFVDNLVCVEKCFLRVKLPWETIEPESCVWLEIAREKNRLAWF
jgi:hypothetical protein